MIEKSLETIYESFVRSKLEYAWFFWGDDCSEQDQLALEKCQLRAARIVTGAQKGQKAIVNYIWILSGHNYTEEEAILNCVLCIR